MYAVYDATLGLHRNRVLLSKGQKARTSNTQQIDKNVVQSKPMIQPCPKSPSPIQHRYHDNHQHQLDCTQHHHYQQQQQESRKARVHFASSVRVHHTLANTTADLNGVRTSPHKLMTVRLSTKKQTTHPLTTATHPASTTLRTFEPLPLKLSRHPDVPLPIVTLQYKLQSSPSVRPPPPGSTTQAYDGARVNRVLPGHVAAGENLRLIYVNDI